MPRGIYLRRVKRHAVTQPLDQSYRLIPLTQGQNAIVDIEDFENLSKFNWHAWWNCCTKSWYPKRVGRQGVDCRKNVLMHFEIMGLMCDHKNQNTLDNRKQNLRPCTVQQNCMNRKRRVDNASGFKGVTFHHGKYEAHIKFGEKQVCLGRFTTAIEASLAYDAVAKREFGEFAHLNFPE